MGVEPKLFCWSEPVSSWVVVDAVQGRGQQARQDWWLSNTLIRPLQALPPHPLGPLPRFGETKATPSSFSYPHMPHPSIPKSEPLLGANKLVFSQSFSSVPPYMAPLVKAEPQRPVKEEEPKTAGDLDQEPVRVW